MDEKVLEKVIEGILKDAYNVFKNDPWETDEEQEIRKEKMRKKCIKNGTKAIETLLSSRQ